MFAQFKGRSCETKHWFIQSQTKTKNSIINRLRHRSLRPHTRSRRFEMSLDDVTIFLLLWPTVCLTTGEAVKNSVFIGKSRENVPKVQSFNINTHL